MRKEIEYHMQVALVRWFRIIYPECLLTISPSGMKLPMLTAKKIKAMGYLKGTPDIMILEPRGKYHGLFVELKAEGGRVLPHQDEFIKALKERGYWVGIAWSFEEAVELITTYFAFNKELSDGRGTKIIP